VTNPVVPEDSVGVASDLPGVLAQMGAVLLSAQTVNSAVNLVTALAAETIEDTIGAGVSLIDGRRKRTTAASSSQVEQADALQYEFDAGPCLTAWRKQVPVNVPDVTTEERWPQWTQAVAGLGVRAVLSVPLVAGGESVGAIKVYSDRPGAYDSHFEHVLGLFARQAAILLTNTQTLSDAQQLTANLTEALRNRDVIGQAKGILLAQGAADGEAAFGMLVTASQRTNIKVRDVARQLVSSVVSDNAARSST